MFWKKQKIEVTVDGGNAAPTGARPATRRIVSDIMPARAVKPLVKAVVKVVVKPAEPATIVVSKIAVPAMTKMAEMVTKAVPAVLSKKTEAAQVTDIGPTKAASPVVRPSVVPRVNVVQLPKVSGAAPARIGGGKFDFLTRQPIADGAMPKLPEKPGVFSRLQEKFNYLTALFKPEPKPEHENGAVMTVAAPHRISAKIATFGIIAALVLIIGGGFFVLNIFSSVTVNIAPKIENVAIDKTFSVAKDGDPATGVIAGELMSFKQAEEAVKETTGKLDANSKSRGRIVIYNAYSAEPQTLVKRTRFETPEGKVYRLLDGAVVPGLTTKSGQTTPGSIEVAVEADQAGEEYNVGLTDFTIPGFKGTARYTKFYGRSKTPMAGGVTSEKRVTARADVDALKTDLAAKLEETIKTRYQAEVPEGFKLLDGAYTIGYEDAIANPPLDAEGDKVTVVLVGNFRGLLIKKEVLAEAIATAYGKDGLAKKARVANVDDLTVSVVRKNLESNEMSIHVSGTARFVWNIDEIAIVNEFLSGKSTAEIFGAHEGIEKAEVQFSPSWWHYIPKDNKRIKVKISGF
jgi:hypothetical protein